MRIAITSIGKDIGSDVSDVFGRCPYFFIAEIKNNKAENIEIMKNESACQTGGAGISTAQLLAEKKIDAVITGNIGPRALDVLSQFNIKIYFGKGAIKNVLQEFIQGKLEEIN